MKTSTFALLSTLLAFGLVGGLAPLAMGVDNDPCVTVPSGYTACGKVTIVGCGIASAEGTATGPVDWKFTVTETPIGSSTNEKPDSTTYAHTTTLPCATNTCTFGVLYADGVEVDRPLGIC